MLQSIPQFSYSNHKVSSSFKVSIQLVCVLVQSTVAKKIKSFALFSLGHNSLHTVLAQ